MYVCIQGIGKMGAWEGRWWYERGFLLKLSAPMQFDCSFMPMWRYLYSV